MLAPIRLGKGTECATREPRGFADERDATSGGAPGRREEVFPFRGTLFVESAVLLEPPRAEKPRTRPILRLLLLEKEHRLRRRRLLGVEQLREHAAVHEEPAEAAANLTASC